MSYEYPSTIGVLIKFRQEQLLLVLSCFQMIKQYWSNSNTINKEVNKQMGELFTNTELDQAHEQIMQLISL